MKQVNPYLLLSFDSSQRLTVRIIDDGKIPLRFREILAFAHISGGCA